MGNNIIPDEERVENNIVGNKIEDEGARKQKDNIASEMTVKNMDKNYSYLETVSGKRRNNMKYSKLNTMKTYGPRNRIVTNEGVKKRKVDEE